MSSSSRLTAFIIIGLVVGAAVGYFAAGPISYNSQINSLTKQLADAQQTTPADLQKAQADLATAQTALAKAQSDLTTSQTQVKTLQTQVTSLQNPVLSGSISISGSTTVQPISQEAANEFMKLNPQMGYPQLRFEDFDPIVYDSFDKLVSHGVGFEVNTSCMRHGAGSFFPLPDFVKGARVAGVKKVTVGSDAHTVSVLGFNISEALNLLKKSGYSQVNIFRGRRSSGVMLEDLRLGEAEDPGDLMISPLAV